DVVDLMGRGIAYADAITTVSETYAREIVTTEYGEGLDGLLRRRLSRLFGVLNGIDAETLNPATDPYIEQHFDAEHLEQRAANKRALQEQAKLDVNPDAPVIGFVSRLTRQKGCDLLASIFDQIMQLGAQVIIVGTGDSYYHEIFNQFVSKYPGQAAAHFTFGADWTQPLYAGTDMYLMPSRFEPCGLNQTIAMRYGSIPIVRATGGLVDTVTEFDPGNESGTGFTFGPYDNWTLFAAIVRALQSYRFPDRWHDLMRHAMTADHSWSASASSYVDIYEDAIDWHGQDIDLHHPSDIISSLPSEREV
ncbi:MAG TPA: glycogen/starch synthase, partial [Ktedonobacterales bacterium]|nr:glycogen/starch synthase [Ktedonobacterales bacterium]